MEQLFDRHPLLSDNTGTGVRAFRPGSVFVWEFELSTLVDRNNVFIEHSTDLQTWSTAGVTTVPLTVGANRTELMRATVPHNNVPRLFGRVRYVVP
jgi:hypothetical protein